MRLCRRSFAMPFIFPHYNITHETNYVHLCVLASLSIRGVARGRSHCTSSHRNACALSTASSLSISLYLTFSLRVVREVHSGHLGSKIKRIRLNNGQNY